MNNDRKFFSLDEAKHFKQLDIQFNNLSDTTEILKREELLYNSLMAQLPPKLKKLLRKYKKTCFVYRNSTMHFFYRSGYADLYDYIKATNGKLKCQKNFHTISCQVNFHR